ncbi:MAG: type I polyketide synthase [Dactylosporangium sp.]|nr:type I polyketide synthase [Dactylosporangium sp.]NNJ59666.1 type I polyketide synthase [Dactylosporangium sp.]
MTSGAERQPSAATLRRAYLTIERMQRKLEAHDLARSEPIAIVGLGCRFPGGVVDGQTYWQLLSNGTDAIGEVPADRWDIAAFYDEQPQRPGKMVTKLGGFLDRVDRFDHEFFGISRREAVAMDPQQRLTLEVAWEALENAGQPPAALAGSRTGVFAGVCTNDFAIMHCQHPLDITAYASTGTAHSAVPGRIAYALDLKGPTIAVDTACSSSLVAVHLACQSLRSGESDLALAGGVNVILSPMTSIAYSQFPGMVSPGGRCRTFDASADGSVPSEGCGFVVLKRLSDAARHNDRILAVVRGSAVNQDGRSSGLTAPSGLAQRDVLRQALEAGGVEPAEVSFIEAHGSGTPLGDPIEVEALAEVYSRGQDQPVYLGTAKTNIGHLQAAAGVAGLIKIILALRHGAIPANLNFDRLNPDISFDGTTFAVPTALTPWPVPEGRRMAGVSSFGFSGTNAHVIVAEAPVAEVAPADARRPLSLLALSAKSESALVELARRYADRLDAGPTPPVADLCYSANTGRSHFGHRLAAVAETSEGIAGQLADFVAGIPGDEPATGRAGNAGVVFLFTGQGSQRVGMARELYQNQPTFRRVVDRCDEILRPHLAAPLLSAIYPSDPDSRLLDQAAYAQPALFAIEYAMAELWRSWGVEAVAVLGHSLGEYVAACVAGALTLEDGLKLVAERGRLMETLTGTMAAVLAPEREVAEAIAGHRGRVAIAAINGPANTVISGDRRLVAMACETFAGRGITTKQLHVTGSGHSALVEPLLPALRRAANRVRFSVPRIALVSNVTGELWPWDEAPDADYWCRHARQPVRFADSVATLRGLGYRDFLEVGPAPTLLGLISDAGPAGSDDLLLPSLRPKYGDWQVLLATVARLYAHGANIDWSGFDRDYQRSPVTVPSYPFEPTRCWQEPRCRDGSPLAGGDGAPGRPDDAAIDPDESDDADLLYQLEWQRAEARTEAPAPADGDGRTWLVLDDDTGVGEQLVSALDRRGSRCIRVSPGEAYHHEPAVRAVVRLDGPGDLTRLLDELELGTDDSLQVVHLWGLCGGEAAQAPAEPQFHAQQHACLSAVLVVQALARARPGKPGRLWLVTRGAVQVGETGQPPLAVSQATLWGLGRSLQQEHPGLWGGLVDLDPEAAAPALAPRLLNEIDNRDREDQIALRGEERYVARLGRARLPEAPARDLVWPRNASYLITGGLTGIGLAVARSMVLAGARRLVLAGRTPIPPRDEWAGLADDDHVGRRVAAVRELESLGASVLLESLDVADEDRMRAFLHRFDREGWPPIRGVVHSAAVAEISPLLELTPDDLRRQLRPKSVGAWVLHRLFADRPLDFFVLFGSASSILSSPFTGAYAAANAFLDALAQLRRTEGKPGLSIGWGLWLGTGMAELQADPPPEATAGAHSTGSVRGQVRLSRGMGVLKPGQGVRLFHQLLRHERAQVAVVPIDWPVWGRRYQEASRSALLARLVDGDGGLPSRRRRSRPSPVQSRAVLWQLPQAERLDRLQGQLHLSVAATLGADPAEVRAEQPLIDLGFDSLMAVELRNELEGQLNIFLPVSSFLADASVKSLTGQIMDLLEATEDGGGTQPTIPRAERTEDLATALLAQIDGLPDEPSHRATRGDDR